MAEYQKIEYRIGKDGKVIETVLNATGASCTDTTAAIEQAFGTVEDRSLLPEYYEGEETHCTPYSPAIPLPAKWQAQARSAS